MKLITLFIVSIYSIVVSFAQGTIVDERTGVKIIFTTEKKIFPDSWYSKKINAIGIPLEYNEYQRSEKIIKSVLSKYPVELIQNNLKNVFVLTDVIFYDQYFGGTNSNSNIYLSNKGIEEGYTDFYLEQLFHAEFSSILLRNFNYIFSKTEWVKNNPPNYNYGNGGVNSLKADMCSEEFDSKLNKIGFINEYSTSSIENDFNAFAKNLFLPKNDFYKLVDSYESIKKKRELIIRFYSKVYKSMTEEYFNKILYQSITNQNH